MTQGLVALAAVLGAAAWLGWHALPRRLRRKLTGGKGGCGPDCSCGS
jgi:hypothetical protein